MCDTCLYHKQDPVCLVIGPGPGSLMYAIRVHVPRNYQQNQFVFLVNINNYRSLLNNIQLYASTEQPQVTSGEF